MVLRFVRIALTAFALVMINASAVVCVEDAPPERAQRTPTEAASTPEPSVTASRTQDTLVPPPEPHELGHPTGLGVKRSTIQSVFTDVGFAFELGTTLGSPSLKGYSTLGDYARLSLTGIEGGLTWVYMEIRWSGDGALQTDYVARLGELAAPKWGGASTWVRENVPSVRETGDEASITYGNYVFRLNFFEDFANVLTLDIQTRYASCQDALMAQEITFQGTVGSARGYADWQVPSAPDDDGDRVVCEGGLPLK